MTPADLDREAETLRREADELDAAISSADLYDAQILAAREAICAPRNRAATALCAAANALRQIPPLGLTAGQGKTA